MSGFISGVVAVLLSICVFPVVAENTTFTTPHFSGSGNCSQCHDNITDNKGEDVSIGKDWGASLMANATKDPFWQAKVASELERNPHLSTVINDKCTQCHAPMANYEITQVQGGDVTLFGPTGLLNPSNALHDAAMNAVSCTVCHQIEDTAELGTLNGFSGKYSINTSKQIYGQYSDIRTQPMINSTGYTPVYSAHISDSAMCATCHNLKTPFVDAEGNIASGAADTEFPEQMPYTEWQHSIFDDAGSNPRSCQDCHMPTTTAKVSTRPVDLQQKAGFAKHHLVGANTVMLELLKNNAAALDVDATHIDTAIQRSRDLLQESASVTIQQAEYAEGVLELNVKVDNISGHKNPTSYPSRRIWLHMKVENQDGEIVFESGKINEEGAIADVDSDEDRDEFEPHYNLITSDDQVQVYEAIMGDTDGQPNYTLLRSARYLKDNRLTPQGFNKLSVPDDIAVVGEAFNDDDFNQGSDEITYRISVENADSLNVQLSMNYQSISHGFVEDLYEDEHVSEVQKFKAMYEAQALKYEVIDTDSLTLRSGESFTSGSSNATGSAANNSESQSAGGNMSGLLSLVISGLLIAGRITRRQANQS